MMQGQKNIKLKGKTTEKMDRRGWRGPEDKRNNKM